LKIKSNIRFFNIFAIILLMLAFFCIFQFAKIVYSKDGQVTNKTNTVLSEQNISNLSTVLEFSKLSNDVKNSSKKGKSKYFVYVDISNQRVYIYDRVSTKLVKCFICSTGMDGYDTPKGEFTVTNRDVSFYNPEYQEGAYFWVQFNGNILFHSIPFDKDYKIEQEEEKKLGKKASHGCVRLQMDDAKWVYDNISSGTIVVVQ
jgi:lipoprotein-anchoring transpeptidase ErfK/SrfK